MAQVHCHHLDFQETAQTKSTKDFILKQQKDTELDSFSSTFIWKKTMTSSRYMIVTVIPTTNLEN